LYAYLFRGSTRGDDLLSYLGSLKSADYPKHIQIEQAWQPSSESVSAATLDAGAHLFNAYCATCHERDGATRLAWLTSFKRLPPDLQTGPWLHLPASDNPQERELRLAQIVKFGVPGTDMPGHEYLSDEDVSSIALWLNRSMVQPAKVASTHYTQGANQ
jgi:mono/diheme cytochrome c family protein